MTDCTVLVLTYKGIEHLKSLLPTLVQAIQNTEQYVIDTIILDNSKEICIENFINSHFPQFKYLACENNYLFSYNEVIENLKSNFIFLLNDDLKVSLEIFNKSLPFFGKDSNLFAVSCLFKEWNNHQVQFSWSDMIVEKGWMKLKKSKAQLYEAKYSFYACGGASFYRTKMFNELKGFDNIYSPAYYEDTDLCHRAWLKGWKTVAHPTAYVLHRTGGSWKDTKSEKKLRIMQQRNRIIGMLINCKEPNFFKNFVLYLPYRMFYSFFFQYTTFVAYIHTFQKARGIYMRRKNAPKYPQFNFQMLLGKKF